MSKDEFQESSAERRYGYIPPSQPSFGRGIVAQKGNESAAVNKLKKQAEIGILPSFNTLPANAGRFAFGQSLTNVASSGTNFTAFTYTVPEGRVINAENFRVNVVDTYDGGGASLGVPNLTLSVSLFVNNGSEPFNQGCVILPFDGFYPCTVIAAPKTTITIRVTYDYSAIAVPPTSVKFKADLTGVMLLMNEQQTENTGLRLPVLPTRGE